MLKFKSESFKIFQAQINLRSTNQVQNQPLNLDRIGMMAVKDL